MSVHFGFGVFNIFKVVALIARLPSERAFPELFLFFDLWLDIKAVFVVKAADFILSVLVKEHALFVVKTALIEQEEAVFIIVAAEFFDLFF